MGQWHKYEESVFEQLREYRMFVEMNDIRAVKSNVLNPRLKQPTLYGCKFVGGVHLDWQSERSELKEADDNEIFGDDISILRRQLAEKEKQLEEVNRKCEVLMSECDEQRMSATNVLSVHVEDVRQEMKSDGADEKEKSERMKMEYAELQALNAANRKRIAGLTLNIPLSESQMSDE